MFNQPEGIRGRLQGGQRLAGSWEPTWNGGCCPLIAVVLLWSISHPDPGIPLGSLGDPRPHRGGVSGKGEQGHSGEATPQRPHGAGSSSKEKPDTLGGSEHHFTEGLDTYEDFITKSSLHLREKTGCFLSRSLLRVE